MLCLNRRALCAPAVCLVLLCGVLATGAPSRADGSGELRAVALDELELRALVRRLGDTAVMEGLQSAGRADALAAIEGSRWLDEPGEAIPALETIALGRDPDLAPAAARVVAAIAQAQTIRDFEVGEREASAPSDGLRGLASDANARADVRLHAGVAVSLLDGVLTED